MNTIVLVDRVVFHDALPIDRQIRVSRDLCGFTETPTNVHDSQEMED